MENNDFKDFKDKYQKLISWIEDNRGKYADDESKEIIVVFFKNLYIQCDKILIDEKSINQISVMVLDCLFYSLLSDSKEDICNLTTKVYNNPDYGEENPVLLSDIKDKVEKWFIQKCFEIFSLSTSVYHDFKIKDKIVKIKKEINDQLPENKDNLISLMEYVLTYIELYSISRTKIIRTEQLSKFDKLKLCDNPYLVGGYINLAIKNMMEEDILFHIEENIEHLMRLNNSGNYTKLNEGYYYLLLARYNVLIDKIDNAVLLCRRALISTNSYCPRNGQRRGDINKFKDHVLEKRERKKDLEKLEKAKIRIDEYKEEVYKLIGILLPVIVIPISVLIAFLEINDAQRDINLVLTLVRYIVFSVLGISIFVILIPYISRSFQHIAKIIEKHLYSKFHKRIKVK